MLNFDSVDFEEKVSWIYLQDYYYPRPSRAASSWHMLTRWYFSSSRRSLKLLSSTAPESRSCTPHRCLLSSPGRWVVELVKNTNLATVECLGISLSNSLCISPSVTPEQQPFKRLTLCLGLQLLFMPRCVWSIIAIAKINPAPADLRTLDHGASAPFLTSRPWCILPAIPLDCHTQNDISSVLFNRPLWPPCSPLHYYRLVNWHTRFFVK